MPGERGHAGPRNSPHQSHRQPDAAAPFSHPASSLRLSRNSSAAAAAAPEGAAAATVTQDCCHRPRRPPRQKRKAPRPSTTTRPLESTPGVTPSPPPTCAMPVVLGHSSRPAVDTACKPLQEQRKIPHCTPPPPNHRRMVSQGFWVHLSLKGTPPLRTPNSPKHREPAVALTRRTRPDGASNST